MLYGVQGYSIVSVVGSIERTEESGCSKRREYLTKCETSLVTETAIAIAHDHILHILYTIYNDHKTR